MQPDFELWVSECVYISKLPPILWYNFMLVFVLQCVYSAYLHQLPGLWTQPSKHPSFAWPSPLLLPYNSGSQSVATLSSHPSPEDIGNIWWHFGAACIWMARCQIYCWTSHKAQHSPTTKSYSSQNSTRAEMRTPRIRSQGLYLPTGLSAPAHLLQATVSPPGYLSEIWMWSLRLIPSGTPTG